MIIIIISRSFISAKMPGPPWRPMGSEPQVVGVTGGTPGMFGRELRSDPTVMLLAPQCWELFPGVVSRLSPPLVAHIM